MKKFLGILVLVLLWCNVSFAGNRCIEGVCKDGRGTYEYYTNGRHYMYKGELYSKIITSSKAYSILKGLDVCRYSSDIKTVAVQIKAKECVG